MISDRPIGVAGAGSIGCFVGGMLAAGGRRVALLGRPRVIEEIESNGLRLTSFDGLQRQVAPNQLVMSEQPTILGDAGAVLVTVKSLAFSALSAHSSKSAGARDHHCARAPPGATRAPASARAIRTAAREADKADDPMK